VLNPLLFGFPIKDNIPPDMIRLAVYDRRYSTYEQVPKIYPLKKVNGVYKPVGGNITVKTDKVSFEKFFQRAKLHPNAHLITGTICGYRIEEIENEITRKVRYLDKLVDELAKGRKMEKILR